MLVKTFIFFKLLLLYNICESHVGLPATVHGGGGVYVTVEIPQGPFLKRSVQPWTPDGVLTMLSPEIKVDKL